MGKLMFSKRQRHGTESALLRQPRGGLRVVLHTRGAHNRLTLPSRVTPSTVTATHPTIGFLPVRLEDEDAMRPVVGSYLRANRGGTTVDGIVVETDVQGKPGDREWQVQADDGDYHLVRGDESVQWVNSMQCVVDGPPEDVLLRYRMNGLSWDSYLHMTFLEGGGLSLAGRLCLRNNTGCPLQPSAYMLLGSSHTESRKESRVHTSFGLSSLSGGSSLEEEFVEELVDNVQLIQAAGEEPLDTPPPATADRMVVSCGSLPSNRLQSYTSIPLCNVKDHITAAVIPAKPSKFSVNNGVDRSAYSGTVTQDFPVVQLIVPNTVGNGLGVFIPRSTVVCEAQDGPLTTSLGETETLESSPEGDIVVPMYHLESVTYKRTSRGPKVDEVRGTLTEIIDVVVEAKGALGEKVVVEEALYRWERAEVISSSHTPETSRTQPNIVRFPMTLERTTRLTYTVVYSWLSAPTGTGAAVGTAVPTPDAGLDMPPSESEGRPRGASFWSSWGK